MSESFDFEALGSAIARGIFGAGELEGARSLAASTRMTPSRDSRPLTGWWADGRSTS